MPYKSMKAIPPSLEGAGLTLKQANVWAYYYDAGKKWAGNPAGYAWSMFKKLFSKSGKKWKVKDKAKVSALYKKMKKKGY